MFETSRDLLNIVLAVSVASVAFFLSWSLFYVALSLHHAYKVAREARDIAKNLKDSTKLLKDRIESSASYIALIAEGVKKIMEFMKDRDGQKERKGWASRHKKSGREGKD